VRTGSKARNPSPDCNFAFVELMVRWKEVCWKQPIFLQPR